MSATELRFEVSEGGISGAMQKIGSAVYRHMQLLATIGALLKFLLVLSRGVFALFVAAAVGFGSYVMIQALYLSIWGYGGGVVVVLVLTTGIGSGIGSYIAWLDREHKLGTQALLLAIVLLFGLAGSYLGLQRGIDIGAVHPIWKPGIPEIHITTVGAVIGANIPTFALGLYKAIRDPRL